MVLRELSHSPSYQDGIYAARAQRTKTTDWAKTSFRMGDYVIEEIVSTRCLGVQIDKAL